MASRCQNIMASRCPRVQQRIECPDCGYPYSEAQYPLDLAVRMRCDPGHDVDMDIDETRWTFDHFGEYKPSRITWDHVAWAILAAFAAFVGYTQ